LFSLGKVYCIKEKRKLNIITFEEGYRRKREREGYFPKNNLSLKNHHENGEWFCKFLNLL
jgi:hypothetical protein